MNALARAAINRVPRTSSIVSKRAASGSAPTGKFSDFDVKVWTSDAGAYPVMFVLAFACAFCGWYGSRNLLTHPDIRISPSKRVSVVRTWGKTE